jgi:hypothetical protein
MVEKIGTSDVAILERLQGDQIWLFFSTLAIVQSGQILKITEVAQIYCINFGKKWIGLLFGRFF